MNKVDVIEEITEDPTCVFVFPTPDKLGPPILRMNEAKIGYGPDSVIAEDVTIDVGFESRIAIVGPNGAGKTTFLKSLCGKLKLIDGHSFIHNRLQIGLFTQHHVDGLDLRLSPVQQMMESYPDANVGHEEFRNHLGSFGISGNLAIRPMYLLSGGQKSRVAFAVVTYSNPHIIVMDEPTNHLDLDAVSALIIALNSFEGGLVIVSHDQYFVGSICDEIYVVKNNSFSQFKGTFDEYKKEVQKEQIAKELANR